MTGSGLDPRPLNLKSNAMTTGQPQGTSINRDYTVYKVN